MVHVHVIIRSESSIRWREESNSKYIYVGVDTDSNTGYGGERILKTEKSFGSGMLLMPQSDLSL